MIAFPVWYLMLGGLLWLMPGNGWIKLLCLLSMPLTGLFAFHYYICFKKLRARYIYTQGVIAGVQDILKIKRLRKDIVSTMHELVNRQIENHGN
jgi:hypothetical protein